MNKGIIIKYFNNNGFEELYPKTLSSQVQGLENTISSVIDNCGFSKMSYGFYIGTNGYGRANMNSLTFNFDPRIVLISYEKIGEEYREDMSVATTIFIADCTQSAFANIGSASRDAIVIFWEDCKVTWYNMESEKE